MQPLADFLARIVPPTTPLLVVRRAALDANLATMQSACDAAGVRLRAHGKMHKSSRMGLAQVAAGAVGLCCQTVGEAQAYAAAGITDLLVTAPVPAWGWARLAALPGRVAAVVDSPAQIVAAAGSGLVLYVDIDLGQHRAGVAPEAAPALARCIADTPGVTFGGVQAYAGHLQHVGDRGARTAAHAAASARLAAAVAALRAAGLSPPQVTGGGTGTYALDLAGGVFTEIQAGSYALMDVDYALAGAPAGAFEVSGAPAGASKVSAAPAGAFEVTGAPAGEWPFAPALFLAASIVSTRHTALATCDAGLKALYTDGPAPRVVAGAAPGSRWRSMGDEHGAIIHPDFIERLKTGAIDAIDAINATDATGPPPADAPAEASIVWLQPGHVDPCVALHDAFCVADEDGRLERWPIDARRVTA